MIVYEIFNNDVYLKAWLNEKLAPELLESKIELVECLLEQIKEMVKHSLFILLATYTGRCDTILC